MERCASDLQSSPGKVPEFGSGRVELMARNVYDDPSQNRESAGQGNATSAAGMRPETRDVAGPLVDEVHCQRSEDLPGRVTSVRSIGSVSLPVNGLIVGTVEIDQSPATRNSEVAARCLTAA